MRLQSKILNALNDARQRFSQCRGLEESLWTQSHQILRHDPGRQDDRLRIRAIKKEEIIAKILLTIRAAPTLPTGSRISTNHPITHKPTHSPGRDLDNCPSQFMTKDARRRQHPGMVPAAVHLQIGTTGQGGPDPNPNLTGQEDPFLE